MEGTIGKEGEVKKKKRGGPTCGLRIVAEFLLIFSAHAPPVECVGVKLISSVNASVVVLSCKVKKCY